MKIINVESGLNGEIAQDYWVVSDSEVTGWSLTVR